LIIKNVEVIPLRLPVKEPLVESGGIFSELDHVVLKISADNSIEGIGEIEAYPSFERPGVETQAGIIAIIESHFLQCLLGQDPFNLENIWQRMDQAVEGYLRVKGGIDSALYDLIAKFLGQPVYNLLGGRVRDEYPVEGVGYGISIGPPEKVAQIARDAVNAGYTELELKGGDSNPDSDIQRVQRVREAIGKKATLKVDFNGFYDPKTAIYVIREMERFGVEWVEQPVKYWDLEGLARVRNSVNARIVVDESVESTQDLVKVIRAQATDGVHIKPTIKGGLTGARKLAAIAEASGVAIIPGTSAPTGVGIAVAQAFIASTRQIARGMHGSPLDLLLEDIVDSPIPPGATRIKIPNKPGLGVSLNEKVISKYRVD